MRSHPVSFPRQTIIKSTSPASARSTRKRLAYRPKPRYQERTGRSVHPLAATGPGSKPSGLAPPPSPATGDRGGHWLCASERGGIRPVAPAVRLTRWPGWGSPSWPLAQQAAAIDPGDRGLVTRPPGSRIGNITPRPPVSRWWPRCGSSPG